MEKETFIANGVFTENLRLKFHGKRIQLGLTYYRLGNFLGVNWSTIRKWEKGLTVHCGYAKREKVMEFILGDYDQTLKLADLNSDYSSSECIPTNIQLCMERLSNTYMICKNSDYLQQNLVSSIERITSEILNEMMEQNERKTPQGKHDDFPAELLDENLMLRKFIRDHC